MSNYLADVVMPSAPEEPMPLTDDVIQEQLDIEEKELEGSYEVDEVLESDEDIDLVPEPVKKQKIPQDEIFTAPKVKTILDPESLNEPSEGVPPTKKPKQTRKKRGPASAEQLERLALGRAKAAETRERKKKEKEERLAKEKADKELVEAVREKERKKLRKKLEEPIEDSPTVTERVVEKPVVVEKGYSQEQLDEAVQRAVSESVNRVEILRKQRKETKKKAEAAAKAEAKVFKDINAALKNDPWAQCFL